MNWALQCARGVAYLHGMKPRALIHRLLSLVSYLFNYLKSLQLNLHVHSMQGLKTSEFAPDDGGPSLEDLRFWYSL